MHPGIKHSSRKGEGKAGKLRIKPEKSQS